MAKSKAALSPVDGKKLELFYVMQSRLTLLLKMGRCAVGRLNARRIDHECSGGPHRILFTAPGDLAFEKNIFERLKKFRCKGEDRPDYEIFRPAPEVWQFLRGHAAVALGFVTYAKPYRERQTAKGWLSEAKNFGCEAAEFALREEKRLRKYVPKTARGGWVLWELISGRLTRQLFLGDWAVESHGIAPVSKLHQWPMHRVTYRGVQFLFPVFVEACERMGARAPKNAIAVGIMPRAPRLPSGRKGKPLRKRCAVLSNRPTCPEQTELF